MSTETYKRAALNLGQISKRFENDVVRAVRVQAHGGGRHEMAAARLASRVLEAMDNLYERLHDLSGE